MLQVLFKNGKKLLTREQTNILSASSAMMFLLLVTKIIGLLAKTVAVSQVGAEKYGIFIAANTLPELLSSLFIFGSITTVIIPLLVQAIQNGTNESFSELFSSIINIGLLSFSFSAFIVIFFAPQITPFVIEKVARPIEPYSAEQINQIVAMMRVLLVPQIVLGISSFISSALNAYKRFVVPQLAPLFYNLGVLFGSSFLVSLLGGNIWGITYGVVIGAILHILIQLHLTLHLKFRYRIIIATANEQFRKVFVVAFPRILALAADQIALGVDRVIAIGLGASSLGAYHLGISLVSIPFSLFSNTFSVAALPSLSESYARKNLKDFRIIFSKVFNQILFFTVPVTMVLIVLRLPFVRLFYGIFGGEFKWEDTLMVAWVVFFFSLGLIPEVLNAFLNRAFYAIHDTIRPLIIGVFVVTGGIITGILFTNYFSHVDGFSLKLITWDIGFFSHKEAGVAAVGGLALSSSIVNSLAFIILIVMLSKRIGGLPIQEFWWGAIRKIVFGLFMGAFMYILFKIWNNLLDTAQTINVLILTISTIMPGFILYAWLLAMFKDPEIRIFSKGEKIIRKLLLT
jgi:putative peptidoglycan lipid II flippase